MRAILDCIPQRLAMQRPEQNLTQIASEPQQPDLNNCLCRSVKREEVEETLLGNQQTREVNRSERILNAVEQCLISRNLSLQ